MSGAVTCKKCGKVHDRCAGHKRRKPGSTERLQPCRARALKGKATCRLHNGNAMAGLAHPNFKHGKRSKYFGALPHSMRGGFNPDDPRLIELHEELALVDSGVVNLLQQLRDGEASAPKWSDLQAALVSVRRSAGTKAGPSLRESLDKLATFIDAGAEQATVNAQVWDLVDRRARLVAVESRRRKEQNEMVDRDDFGRAARAMLQAVSEFVIDRVILMKIQTRIGQILNIATINTNASAAQKASA